MQSQPDPTNPHPGESHADFMGRCMGDPNMTGDYPEENQRLAVCFAFWQDAHKPKSAKAADWRVGAARDLPIEDGDRAWDGNAAAASIFDAAGGENFDPARARRGFLIYDASDPSLRGSYKLPIARGGQGGLRVPKSGIRAAASYLPQTDAPAAVLARAQAVLDAYKAKAGMDTDDGKSGRSGQIHLKQTAAPPPNGDVLEYIMSDGSIDRMGDIIEPEGWMLDNFRKNPVALFGHDTSFPIGKWRDVGVRDGNLAGRLELMKPVSDRLREIHAAVEAGVLRAVSVGFHSNNFEPLEGSKNGGLHFLETELVECSLVSVPANPNALAIAKGLGISREGQRLIFGVSAETGRALARRGRSGVSARNTTLRKPRQMDQLSERIQSAQGELVTMRDELSELIEIDDVTKSAELTDRIEQVRGQLAVWERAEKALGGASEPITLPSLRPSGSGLAAPRPRAWPQTKKKDEKPGYLFLRHCVVQTLAHAKHKAPEQVLQERYGDYGDFEATKAVHEWFTRASTAPATMTQAGWAAELAQVQYGEFFDVLMPGSIYAPLSTHGFRASLGRFATLTIPTRTQTPVVAGSFVGEGTPIPVRQAQTAAVSIGLKKLAVIVSYTREIAEHSTPQIEELLRRFIGEDTGVAVDTVLIDANAATSVRPAGLRSGVAGLTPTAGGGFTALVGDIKQMVSVLAAANALREPVWILHPTQATSISLTATANGVFPFKLEIDNRMLQGYPTIISSTMPVGTILLLDAADFVSITGDDPRFEVSDQATLHFDDTTPLQIGTPGTPNVVAAPVRNLFQTDSLALRMILPMNWIMRRAGVLAWIAGVTW